MAGQRRAAGVKDAVGHEELPDRVSLTMVNRGAYPEPLPAWHDATDEERQAWRTAVDLVADSVPVTDRGNFPVTIYIADKTIHKDVETAVEDWLTAAGLDIVAPGETRY